MSEVAEGKLHSILRLEVSKTIYQILESQILGQRTMDKSSRLFPLTHDLTCKYIYPSKTIFPFPR